MTKSEFETLRTLEGNLKIFNMVVENTIKNENGEETNTVKFADVKSFAEYINAFCETNIDFIQSKLDALNCRDEEKAFAHLLPRQPIEVAEFLINADEEEELFGGKMYKIFEIDDLRQIAEHLLIYCDYNEGRDNE